MEEREERVEAGKDGLSTAKLEGADRARSLEMCVSVCVCSHTLYLCICMAVVLMYLFSTALL